MFEAPLVRRVFVWLVLYQLCWQAYLDELENVQLVSDTHTYPHRCSPVKRHENIRQEHPLRNSKFLFNSFPVPVVIGTKIGLPRSPSDFAAYILKLLVSFWYIIIKEEIYIRRGRLGKDGEL